MTTLNSAIKQRVINCPRRINVRTLSFCSFSCLSVLSVIGTSVTEENYRIDSALYRSAGGERASKELLQALHLDFR